MIAGFDALSRRVEASTPPGRDRYVDALRVMSLLVVVLGHWLMAVVTDDGQITNALVQLSWLKPATWFLQPMPVFFLVGGVAHALSLDRRPVTGEPGSYAGYFIARALRLLRPTWVFLGVWLGIGLVAHTAGWTAPTGAEPSLIQLGLGVVTQLLWFLGVYVGVAAMAPMMYRLHQHHGWRVPAVLAACAALVDVIFFTTGTALVRTLNFLFVWLAIHQLGFCWKDLMLTRRVAAAVAGLGLASLLVCVTVGPYPVSMVGMPGERISNMAPPTFALLSQGVMLVGLTVLMRPWAQRLLARPRVWATTVLAGTYAMTIYLWHLTGLIIVVALAWLFGVHLPAPGTATWWLTRPLWYLVLIIVTIPLVVLFQRLDAQRLTVHVGRFAWVDPAARLLAALLAVITMMVSVTGVDVLGPRHVSFLGAQVTPALALTLVVLSGAALVALRRTGPRRGLSGGAR